ncbi:hypothetical protein OEW28_07315 [Defluviimonas sp. WL0002]|uniref:Formamidopyrimidine-DNA glycosylase catalytic domain-containing protein n=1 Tax=Albidovulum marisflavi TaxID=2984159 RepID=A0ABT2ZBK3_9RHOB|nr:DNA-formamidopyrimidine glycosylase family protein [Defluviimonas sp. WL0002]MCV2868435.1 hypothetical protein [Defluviimonas sp. WL0002]
MPELPEIEAFRRQFDTSAIGRRVDSVDVADEPVLAGRSARELRQATAGDAFCKVLRHGKLLFARTNGGTWVVFRFGMTGRIAMLEPDGDPPDHTRIMFGFNDGGRMAFDDQRKFGSVELAADVEIYLERNDIGPDALGVCEHRFRRIIGCTRGQVKPALMDQSKLSGIGNVYSDEILYQAGIRPDAKGQALDDGQLERLHGQMRMVLETAINRIATGKDLPDDWLTPHRGKDGKCPDCGEPLERKRISGRTAWFCPRSQHHGQAG